MYVYIIYIYILYTYMYTHIHTYIHTYIYTYRDLLNSAYQHRVAGAIMSPFVIYASIINT